MINSLYVLFSYLIRELRCLKYLFICYAFCNNKVEKHLLFFDFIIDYDAPFTVIIPRDNVMSNIVGTVNNEEFFL